MHIPDGLMDPRVALIGFLEFAIVFGVALALSKRRTAEKDLPRIALLSAGIFVAQMVNFPVGGGTTGHLIGAALFAVLAGPVVAIIGMTVVLTLQALMFGDGGVTAFGLNAVNMAVIAPLVGWGVFTMIRQVVNPKGTVGDPIALAAAAWASVFVSAAACAAELAVSFAISGGDFGITGTVAVPAMLGYHAVIGFGEAAISVGVYLYIARETKFSFGARRGTVGVKPSRESGHPALMAGIAILLVFALVLPLYFLYSANGEDGLEKTMANAGKNDGNAIISSPFSYWNNYFEALFAGLLGFLAAMALSLGVLKLLRRSDSSEEA